MRPAGPPGTSRVNSSLDRRAQNVGVTLRHYELEDHVLADPEQLEPDLRLRSQEVRQHVLRQLRRNLCVRRQLDLEFDELLVLRIAPRRRRRMLSTDDVAAAPVPTGRS
jgi:hypothetical protein